MNLRSLMLAGAAAASLGLGGHVAQAAPCPTLLAAKDTQALAGHCNLIITFNADGSISTAGDKGSTYDGSDDALVGVVNNTSAAIGAFAISGSDIFGFDTDGLDSYLGIPNNAKDTTATPGYGGANAYFTGIDPAKDAGTVNFIVAIAAGGGTSYFGLEEAIDLRKPPTIVPVNPVPEPVSLALLGSGLLGLGFVKLRRG